MEVSLSQAKSTRAVGAIDVPPRAAVSFYPEPFAARMAGRQKRQLGEFFGLKNFGVNLTRLAPKAMSSLRHAHLKQDEFVYVVQGNPTLHNNEGSQKLAPGMCVGFPAGTGNAHHLHNETESEVLYLEIGDRTPGEEVAYPDDDIQIVQREGKMAYVRKDGTPY
jgi:uncharacterized cupin superfamily protein